MREELTAEELLDLDRTLHYALGTQFGEVPDRARKNAVGGVMKMWIEDLLTVRINGVPEHVKRKQ